jgi:hypothetical protein
MPRAGMQRATTPTWRCPDSRCLLAGTRPKLKLFCQRTACTRGYKPYVRFWPRAPKLNAAPGHGHCQLSPIARWRVKMWPLPYMQEPPSSSSVFTPLKLCSILDGGRYKLWYKLWCGCDCTHTTAPRKGGRSGNYDIIIDYHTRGTLLAKVLRYLPGINKTKLNSTSVAWVGQWGCQCRVAPMRRWTSLG